MAAWVEYCCREAYRRRSITLGSALEMLLILMINCFPDEVEQLRKIPSNEGGPKPHSDIPERSTAITHFGHDFCSYFKDK